MDNINNLSNSSPLLINESPLQVLPSLVIAFNNINEAVLLQQIQYWLKNPKSGRIGEDGRKYIRDTYEELQEQLPWLTTRSIKRIVKDLKNSGILLTANLNKTPFDRTQWYSIDYEQLNKFIQISKGTKDSDTESPMQDDTETPSLSDTVTPSKSDASSPTIPKTSSKTSPETSTKNSFNKENEILVPPNGETKEEKNEDKQVKDNIPYKEVINYLNSKTGKNLRYTTRSYQRLIRARWNDGYRLKDFKQVIDNKAFSWQGTDFWKFMRPDTLFAPKHFDDYLNENNTDGGIPHGGYDINEKEQQEFLNQVKDDDLPF